MTEISFEVNEDAGAREALENAVETALHYLEKNGLVSIVVVDDDTIHEMNRTYRKVDRATDVLSFPALEGEELPAEPDGFLGDLAISLPRAKAQAEEYDHSVLRELSFLAIHGTLHLLGYDHVEDETEMFALQREILNSMGITRETE